MSWKEPSQLNPSESAPLSEHFIACVLRRDVRRDHRGNEVATCDLVRRMLDIPASDHRQRQTYCEVDRSVCEYCRLGSGTAAEQLKRLAEVTSRTMLSATTTLLDASPKRDLFQLQALAEAGIEDPGFQSRQSTIYGCDVVVVLGPDEQANADCVGMLLRANQVAMQIHTLGHPRSLAALNQRFPSEARLSIYEKQSALLFQNPSASTDPLHPCSFATALLAATLVTPKLRSAFVAFASVQTRFTNDRFASAIERIGQSASEIDLCPIQMPGGAVEPPQLVLPVSSARQSFWETMVIRRATWVDLQLPAATNTDTLSILDRAVSQTRRISIGPSASVLCKPQYRSHATVPAGADHHTTFMQASFMQASLIGQSPRRCDVVLPFHGQRDFVRQAAHSILNQCDVEPVLHMINDASPEDFSSLKRELASDHRVRWYENATNLGQFTSFNNVARFFETDFVAVQDGDDISQPDRLRHSLDLLHLAGADLMGGTLEMFGSANLIAPMTHARELHQGREVSLRFSRYPSPFEDGYFLENPTVVMRTDLLRRLGGYTDFGNLIRNKTSLDTEFGIRAHYSGARIAITRRIMAKYRMHDQSATHDRATSLSSQPRLESGLLLAERLDAFRQMRFDPRSYGAMGKYAEQTQRVPL